jgi:hypothetical protein
MSAGETQKRTIKTYTHVKTIFTILVLCSFVVASAQTEEAKVIKASKEFHQALVSQNKVSLNQQTDKALTYGHSNGWIQSKADLVGDFVSGKITYHSITEDSVSASIDGNLASVRFNGVYDATNTGVRTSNHLKVLEVWVKKGSRWILFSRQGFKPPYMMK